MSDQTPDQSDPYADLRRTLPDATPGPWVTDKDECCVYDTTEDQDEVALMVWHNAPFIAAANPDTIARLLAERDRLHGALHMACSDGWADGEGAMQGYLRHGAEMGPPAPTAFPNPEATR